MFFSNDDIGIDLGTSMIMVCVKAKGIIVREPSVVAIDAISEKAIEFGEEAKKMIGKTPENIKTIRPLKHGVISDIDITEQLLKHYIDAVKTRYSISKPRVVICVPALVSQIERRAVEDAAFNAGARKVLIIEEPLAAALGADLDIESAEGSMICDIGGGTSDIAVISLKKIVCSGSVKIGGDDFDDAIQDYLRGKKYLLVGDRTAEEIKMALGRAIDLEEGEENRVIEVKGRSIQDGYPKQAKIEEADIYYVCKPLVDEIIRAIKKVFEHTPPELAADIFDKGICLTGGGALLRGFDKAIEREIGIDCLIYHEAQEAVIKGISKIVHDYDKEYDIYTNKN